MLICTQKLEVNKIYSVTSYYKNKMNTIHVNEPTMQTHEPTTTTTCLAIIQSGSTKGSRCFRPQTQDGYCLKHQGVKERDRLKESGNTLCANNTRGCSVIMLPTDLSNGITFCEGCKDKKKTKHFPCKHSGCAYSVVTENTYCMKHVGDYLRDKEKEDNIKYCKLNRGCRNVLKEGHKECDECTSKHRSSIESIYKENDIVVSYIPYSDALQQFQERTYDSIEETWRGFQKRAYDSRILLAINYEQFKAFVINPCYYCGFHTTMKVNGLDRINNHKGYILSNVISCCRICNELKHTAHPNAFLDKIDTITKYNKEGICMSEELKLKWVNTFCSKNYDKYTTYKNMAENVRRIQFHLSESDYYKLKKEPCYICGIESDKYNINGIDRVNSSGIYNLENCKACCGHCNMIKRNNDIELFLSKCSEISKYKCNRSIFNNLVEYDYTRTASRNESYSANDIYDFIENNSLTSYTDWCKDANKTDEHITNIIDIAGNKDLSKEDTLEIIEDELRIEKTRDTEINAYITGNNVYNMLVLGKKGEFIEWMEENKGISALFNVKLDELIKELPSKPKQQAVELCRDFMYAEKNRRNRQTSVRKITPIAKEKKHTKDVTITADTKKIMHALAPPSIQLPKQWKASNVYKFIKDGNETYYYDWCKEHNNITEDQWNKFIDDVTSVINNKEESINVIEEFIVSLRGTRTQKLLDAAKENVVDRDDRQQWPSASVLKAYKEGKINAFKIFTEKYANDSGPKWESRWTKFVDSLEGKVDEEAIKLISAFMAAQRKKKYDRTKASKT